LQFIVQLPILLAHFSKEQIMMIILLCYTQYFMESYYRYFYLAKYLFKEAAATESPQMILSVTHFYFIYIDIPFNFYLATFLN